MWPVCALAFGLVAFASCSDDGDEGGVPAEGEKYGVSILTQPYSDLASTTVTLSGTCNLTGTPPQVYTYGIVYGTSSVLEAGGENVVQVQGGTLENGNKFSISATGLEPNERYYYRAYFETGGVYQYGSVRNFRMKPGDDGIDIPTEGEVVDLGLGVKWASCNVGAAKPEEKGSLVGWGDPSGNYKYQPWDIMGDYYVADRERCFAYYGGANPPSDICGTDLDIAYVKSDGALRLPTEEEMAELVSECLWKPVTYNGTKGRLVIGRNGNKIFMPSVGRRDGSRYDTDTKGLYWTGTLCPLSEISGNEQAYSIGFFGDEDAPLAPDGLLRYIGAAVRPVANE